VVELEDMAIARATNRHVGSSEAHHQRTPRQNVPRVVVLLLTLRMPAPRADDGSYGTRLGNRTVVGMISCCHVGTFESFSHRRESFD